MPATLRDVIKEAMLLLGGEASVEQIKNFVSSHYGPRWSDVGTAIADLTYPGSKSSQYPEKERFLERIGRGTYRLRVRAAISKEVFLLWRRTVSDVRGDLLGIFSDASLAFEKIRGKRAIDYHLESWPLNKFEPSDSEMSIYLGKDKDGFVI